MGKFLLTNASSILLMDRESLPDWGRHEAPLKSPATKSTRCWCIYSTDCKQPILRDSAFLGISDKAHGHSAMFLRRTTTGRTEKSISRPRDLVKYSIWMQCTLDLHSALALQRERAETTVTVACVIASLCDMSAQFLQHWQGSKSQTINKKNNETFTVCVPVVFVAVTRASVRCCRVTDSEADLYGRDPKRPGSVALGFPDRVISGNRCLAHRDGSGVFWFRLDVRGALDWFGNMSPNCSYDVIGFLVIVACFFCFGLAHKQAETNADPSPLDTHRANV